MKSVTTLEINSNSYADTLRIAGTLGRKLRGGETIELVGDLGAGKTAFVRGLAEGIESRDQVQSPSFTIARIYHGKAIKLHHYDFHRLEEPGVVRQELTEALAEPKSVVVIEWSDVVRDVLPKYRLRVLIEATGDDSRHLIFEPLGQQYQSLIKGLT